MRDTTLITTSESARILDCGTENVRRLARAGHLQIAATVGHGQRLFERAEVERLAAQRSRRSPMTTTPGDEAA